MSFNVTFPPSRAFMEETREIFSKYQKMGFEVSRFALRDEELSTLRRYFFTKAQFLSGNVRIFGIPVCSGGTSSYVEIQTEEGIVRENITASSFNIDEADFVDFEEDDELEIGYESSSGHDQTYWP